MDVTSDAGCREPVNATPGGNHVSSECWNSDSWTTPVFRKLETSPQPHPIGGEAVVVITPHKEQAPYQGPQKALWDRLMRLKHAAYARAHAQALAQDPAQALVQAPALM